jgi:hypothetical protein
MDWIEIVPLDSLRPAQGANVKRSTGSAGPPKKTAVEPALAAFIVVRPTLRHGTDHSSVLVS